uniref:Uncharacterized protein n=1 Tax=Anguilla anguilla TaxID=7936 RepID=A0A0E9WTV4_ANGAN
MNKPSDKEHARVQFNIHSGLCQDCKAKARLSSRGEEWRTVSAF